MCGYFSIPQPDAPTGLMVGNEEAVAPLVFEFLGSAFLANVSMR